MLTPTLAHGLVLPRVEAVVIGTSAGGVAALDKLLPGLPAGTPFPVIVVVHLGRQGQHVLLDVLGPRCAVAVREATDKQSVDGATVWFAPPDYHLLVEADRTFALSTEGPVNYCRPAIDPLFESAAAAYGPALVGIILTGANEDGARGAAAVRETGGMLIVEDPAGAEVAAMPAAAIARTQPDAIGSIADIASMLRLAALGRAR